MEIPIGKTPGVLIDLKLAICVDNARLIKTMVAIPTIKVAEKISINKATSPEGTNSSKPENNFTSPAPIVLRAKRTNPTANATAATISRDEISAVGRLGAITTKPRIKDSVIQFGICKRRKSE